MEQVPGGRGQGEEAVCEGRDRKERREMGEGGQEGEERMEESRLSRRAGHGSTAGEEVEK